MQVDTQIPTASSRPDDGRPRDWAEEEPGLGAMRKELYRLGKRAARRPVLTLGLAFALTAGAVHLRTRKPPTYEATIIMAITEGGHDITQKNAPRPPAQLKAYMSDVALSSSRLEQVMVDHDLYPSLRRLDMKKAIDAFREDIDIDVYNNYFLLERSPNDPPRSARVAVTFVAGRQHIAQDVVHALGALVVEEEAHSRQDATARAAASAADGVETLRADLLEQRAAVTRLELSFAHAKGDDALALEVELENRRRELRAAQDRLDKAGLEQLDLDLRARMEARDLGLRFEIAEETLDVSGLPLGRKKLAFLIVAVLAIALPLSAVFVGAFDTRIHDLEDVRRLGMVGVGHVPPFPGDHVGAMSDRRP